MRDGAATAKVLLVQKKENLNIVHFKVHKNGNFHDSINKS